MTDNEKRAHDLAVAMIPIAYKMAKEAGEGKSFSADETYFMYYHLYLESMSHHFPDNQ